MELTGNFHDAVAHIVRELIYVKQLENCLACSKRSKCNYYYYSTMCYYYSKYSLLISQTCVIIFIIAATIAR